jgi:hypothetical protein
MRFPCGKWGSMGLFEGAFHTYFAAHGAQCRTQTNEIDSLYEPHRWREHRLSYYKHSIAKGGF